MNNLTENQNNILKWVIAALVLAALAFFGVKYPEPGDIPPFPSPIPIEIVVEVQYPDDGLGYLDEEPIQQLGTTNFDDLEIDNLTVAVDTSIGGDLAVTGNTTWGITSPTLSDNLTLTGTLTAEDGVITDTLDVNGDIDLDGDGFDVNITAGFSVDGDAASNINVAGAGIDLTLEAEAGRLVLKGDEALADAVHIDADDAAGTGLTINVGASGGVLISGGLTDIGGGTCGTATGDNDLCVADGFEVDGAADLDGTLDVDGTSNLDEVDIDGATNLVTDTEHIGIPSIFASTIVTTVNDGALWTIGDGEIWIVHGIWIRVTTNFDCTGSDCTLILGDDLDTDGFCVLADAEMQAADTVATGFPAGWQCMEAATRGVYLDEVTTNAFVGGFVYAPSGGDQTIDIDVGGTDPVAGAATVYIQYTRIQ